MSQIRLLVAMWIAGLVAGCGGSGASLGTVEGTVTLDGASLVGANVGFQPAEGSASFGVTDGSGHYELYFAGDTKGAVLGLHTVRITTPSPSEDDPQQHAGVPAKYNTQTELTATVEKGSNKIDFTLTSN